MATIGSLAYVVTANTAGFAAGMRSAQSNVSSFESSINQAGNSLAGFATKMAGMAIAAVAAKASLEAILGSIHDIADSAKQAERLGTTANALGRLQAATGKFGTDAEGTVHSLQKLTEKIGEATNGSTEANKAFDSIGLSAKKLATENPTEAFRDISEAISRLPNRYEQAAAAQAIFGREGLQLVGALKLGKQGLDELGDKAQKSGLVMSNIDAQKALDADRAIGSLSKTLKGFGNILAVTVAPIVEGVAAGLTTLVECLEAVASNFSIAGDDADSFSNSLDSASAAADKLQSSAKQMSDTITGGATAAVKAVAEALKEMEERAKEAAKAHEKLEEAGKQLTQSVRNPFEVYEDSLSNVNNLLAENVISLQTFQRASLKAFEAYDKATEAKKTMEHQQGVGAVTRNSTAGFSAEHQGERDAKAQLEESKKQTAHQLKMAQALEQIKQRGEAITVKTASL